MTRTLIRTIPEAASPSRRTTLKWLGAVMAAAPLAACGESPSSGLAWPVPAPLTGPGYGRDPNMLEPSYPWPLTMTRDELMAVAALVDLILPEEDGLASGSGAGIPAFLDEWISAPYPDQQKDRALILPGLAWLDAESMARSGRRFAHADLAAQKAIADDIAFRDRVKPGLEKPAEFFGRVRSLALGAWFTTAGGWDYLGYLGNRPASGDYAGPTPEALEHLAGVLASMGLAMPEE